MQEKVKRARTQEEKMAANQEMMEVYKKYDINPMKSALGCLPVLIQMPVVMGLYFVLRYRIGGGIAEHPHFLWFNLIHPDIWITIIAGVLYFIQAWVSSKQMPQEQRQMTYMMMIVSNHDYLDFIKFGFSFRFILVSQCGILGCSNILRQYVL